MSTYYIVLYTVIAYSVHCFSYLESVQFLRAVRNQWPGDLFGVTSTDDVPACLTIYCHHICEERKNGGYMLLYSLLVLYSCC